MGAASSLASSQTDTSVSTEVNKAYLFSDTDDPSWSMRDGYLLHNAVKKYIQDNPDYKVHTFVRDCTGIYICQLTTAKKEHTID